MNILGYIISPLTNVVYSIFGWKYQELIGQDVISSQDVISILSIPDLEAKPCPINSMEPKLTSLKNKPRNLESDLDLDSNPNFDQKLLNRKNYNQKRKLLKPKIDLKFLNSSSVM